MQNDYWSWRQGGTKGRSTKKYILLYNPNAKGKPSASIKEAIQHRYPVVSYEYVYDCIRQNQNYPTARYEVKLPHIACKVTVEPSLQRQFNKTRSFISLVKGPRSRQTARRNVKLVNLNKANLRDLIAATGLVILLKLDLNRWFFSPCDLEIWWMTPKNNRAPLLCYFKLFASFRSHWWIQTGVKVRKRLIWVNIRRFF